LEQQQFKAAHLTDEPGIAVDRGNRLQVRGTMMDAPAGWTLEDGGKALVRSMKFRDFSEAFGFLARVALHAEKVDHHPEFTSVWNRVDFRLTSHDAGGVTDRDLELAETINRLVGS
jgi:4a-hydroxytetrahydrobiopterin dehydratase